MKLIRTGARKTRTRAFLLFKTEFTPLKKASETKGNLIMCLYPRLIKNRRLIDKSQIIDTRMKVVPIGCGNCIECRRQKANSWRIRLHEELKEWKHSYFVTMTFSNEALKHLEKECGSNKLNVIASKAIRRFLERYRKKYGKSLRHWYITELGHENTERLHIHGIVFTNNELNNETYSQLWSYGLTDLGQYCNKRTINYIVKYVTKIDEDHKDYKPIIDCSAGLGATYINKYTQNVHQYKPNKTKETYTLDNGTEVAMPIYYRNKFYTDMERQLLWKEKLDKHTIYVRGLECKKINTEKGILTYLRILKQQQEESKALGYGDLSKEWQKQDYNLTLRMLNKAQKKAIL